MAIDFPTSPLTNDTYSYSGRTWIYNGTAWALQGVTNISPFSGIFTVTNTTNATSTVTGAVQVIGGVGVGKDVYAGGNIQSNSYTVSMVTNAAVTGSIALDLSRANYFKLTFTGGTTISFINTATSNVEIFVVSSTNGGAYSLIWPTSVKWPSGVAPTLTAAGTDILVFSTDDGGTTVRGVLSQADSK